MAFQMIAFSGRFAIIYLIDADLGPGRHLEAGWQSASQRKWVGSYVNMAMQRKKDTTLCHRKEVNKTVIGNVLGTTT